MSNKSNMENKDIKKDNFAQENFSAINFLNEYLKPESESEIFSFKLKIVQREFSNEVDLNFNNINKNFKNYSENLKNLKLISTSYLGRINELSENHIRLKE